jgi:acyl-CoA synthetase (AMP-forming)/AMP-acid ligase II/acyl carrier protein
MSILALLEAHATTQPTQTAFVYLEDGEQAEQRISFAQLYQQVCELGVYLLLQQVAGQRVVLLYQQPVEFIVAFLACCYAGVVAVPAHYTRSHKQLARLRTQLEDAGATAILTTADIAAHLGNADFLGSVALLTGPIGAEASVLAGPAAPLQGEEVAFIQYTSGSTSQPKGVVVSHQNLLSNQQALREAFGCDAESVIVCWLPFHHDMGLIGNLLHAVYIGCTCVLMAPQYFMQKPRRWLQAISHYRATHSGGPNFAYQYCLDRIADEELVGLDLTTWRVAYCGSEPVRKETADRFGERFRVVGFRDEAFCPCYGLAEATLLVSSAPLGRPPSVAFLSAAAAGPLSLTDAAHPATRAVMSAGRVAHGMLVQIAGPDHLPVATELAEGEICLAGPSVSQGYWNRDNQDVFYTWEGTPFLRTGDLGFFWQGELFVHGRIKEVLIVRGRNYYPHDLEQLILDCDEALESNGAAVFAALGTSDEVVVLAEVRRSYLRQVDGPRLASRIAQVVRGFMGVEPADVLLLPPLAIPRTTSGKLKRVQAREQYARQEFRTLASRSVLTGLASNELASRALARGDHASIRAYLAGLLEQKAGPLPNGGDLLDLSEVGIDSLRSMELLNAINRDLVIGLDASVLLQHRTLADLVNVVETLMWLKNSKTSDKEIIL